MTAWRPSDRVVADRRRRGDPNRARIGGARVSDEYVRCVRRAHDAGASMDALCVQFPKLRRSALQSIVNRQSWRHVR